MTNFNFLSNPVAKTLQNAGGGTSHTSEQFSRYCVSRSEGAHKAEHFSQKTYSLFAVAADGQPTVNRQSRLRYMVGKASVITTFWGAFLSNCLRSASALRPFRLRLDSLSLPSRFRVLAKYAATLTVFMCLGVGNAWGANQTYTLTNPTTDVHSSGSITIQGQYSTSAKVDNVSKAYTIKEGPLYIFSKAANIKAITFRGISSSSGSSGTTNCANIKVQNGASFETPASFTATTDGSSLASLSNIAITKVQTSHTEIAVTFATAVSAVEISPVSSSSGGYAYIGKIEVTYDDAVTVPTLFSEGHFTSTTTGSATNGCSWGSFTLNSTTKSVDDKAYYKRKDEAAILYNVPVGKPFAAGDVILIDFTGGDASKNVAINLTNGPSWAHKTGTQTEHNFIYVIPAGSALVNATAFSFQIMNTDTYVYGVRVYKPVSNTKPSSVSIGDQWLTFVGEPLTLTASLTGGSGEHTYQWYKGGTSEGNKIAGATSATYYKASSEASDADDEYYCKVSTDGDDDVWSSAYTVKVLRLQLMWKDGTNVSDYTFHNFRPLGGNKATVSIPLEAYEYSYYIIDGFEAKGNSGTIMRSNYTGTPWTHNVSNQRTGLNCDMAGTYTFTIDYSTYSSWQVSVGFPENYYYKGNEDGWSSTHAMTVSCDGSYAYYWAKGKNSLNALDKGNNNNFLIVNSAGSSNLATGDNLEIRNGESSGFGGTDIWGTGHMGKWDGETNASIYNENDFYIVVFFPKTYVNTTSSPKICASTKLPDTGTTADELVYFDNSESWSNVYYRIGHRGYNDATAMTAVPGTARLYKMTTVAWAGYEAWNIANNKGNYGSHSIYDITTNTITGATNYFKCEDDGNITILLDGVHNTESGCTYYNVATSAGLLTHTATVGATTNGSIRLNWTDISNTAQSATSTTAGLAHTCNLQVTGVPNTGYEIATLTVNGAAFTSGNTHVLAADATIAATFSLVNYNVTYSAPSNGNYTIQVASGSASSETKTATYGQTITLAASANIGYHFDSWTVTGATSGDNITVTNNQFTMPAEDVTVTATFAANTYTITLNRNGGSGDNQVITATYGSSSLSAAVTTPEKDGYDFRGWYNASGGTGYQVINTSGTLNASVTGFTNSSSEWTYTTTSSLTLVARWTRCQAYSFTYGTNGSNDWASACFTQVGETHEWNIEDFVIPNKPNFYVGWTEDFVAASLGSNSSWSVERAWTDVPSQSDSKWQGQMVLLPTASSAVGQATGAIGKLVIWDNSANGNLCVGFEPNGYGVTYNSGTVALTETDPATHLWESAPVTLVAADVSGTFQVKLATSSSYVVCAHGTAEAASVLDGRNGTRPDMTTGQRGKFRMWANSATNNWALDFMPVCQITFDMQDHGDAIGPWYINYNTAASAPSPAPTANGYTFGGWYDEAACRDGHSIDWSAALTADKTVYAKWTCTTPTIGTNLSTTEVVYDKDASASALTIAATAGGGDITYQWYSNTANSTTTPTPTTLSNCTTATYMPSTASAGTTYYYCVATNSTGSCSTTTTSNIAMITIEDPCFYANDLKKKKGGSDIEANATITASLLASGAITGGTLTNTSVGALGHSEKYGLVYAASGEKEVTLALTEGSKLVEGSKITLTGYSNESTNDVGFKVGNQAMSEGDFTPASAAYTLFTRTYTLGGSSPLVDKTSFKITASTSEKVYLTSIKITGCGEYSCTAPTSPSIAISDDDGDNDNHLSSSALTFTASATGTDGSTTYTWYRCQTADDIATTKASGTPIQAASTSTTYTISFLKDGNLAAGGDEAIYLCKISNGTGCDAWAQTSLDVTPAASVSITYHLNGASWVGGYTAPSSYRPGAEGATLPIASNMVNTGYTFGGWYANSDLSTGGVVTSITTSDSGAKEYWAKWTENTYTITYDKNGGTGSDMSTTVGHYVTLSNNSYTAPSGKIFAEWNTASDGSGASHSEGEEIELTADLPLYAIWASDYTITWDASAKLGGVDATPNLGGGNYTITASVADWTGTLTADMVSTPTAGVTITNVALDNSASPKTATVTFAVTEDVTGDAITLTIDVPANGSYGAKSSDKVISISRCEGGTTLFSQDFDEATEVAYVGSSSSTPVEHTYNTSSTLSGLVGTGTNLFTHLSSSIKKGDIAINSSTGGNSVDATGIFQVYSNGDNGGYWSLTRTTDFTGSPTAMKVTMEMYYTNLSSGSDIGIQFAIGDGFTGGYVSTTAQSTSNVHSGFALYENSTAKIMAYNNKNTTLYNTGITQSKWLSVTWVINNTGSDLTYDNPTGSGTTTLANDKFDIWVKLKSDAASKYTKVVSAASATTASKDLNEIYIGYNHSGKKHEFRLDNVRVVSLSGAGGKVSPTLTWSAPATVDKETGNADFTYTASTTSNTLGAITYTSSNTSVATVNSTGKVHIVGVGSATITATLAATGCYNGGELSYTLNVTSGCDDVAGTIVNNDGSAIEGDAIEMSACATKVIKVTGHTAADGVTYQWYKDGVSLGSANGAQTAAYTIPTSGAGEYYVTVTNTGGRHCAMVSTNTITVTNTSSLSIEKVVHHWYVKAGRRTPDIALAKATDAVDFVVEAGGDAIWSTVSGNVVTTGLGGCGFYMDKNGVIYLKGTKDNGDATDDITADKSLKILVHDVCNSGVYVDGILIHRQAATTYKEVAFVVDGTRGGAWNAVESGHADGTPLYEYLDSVGTAASARKFMLSERNIYKTTVDSTLRSHYSQFDAIIITDDPNTMMISTGKDSSKKKYQTEGYVNAMGTLIDVRPMLTMEAFVSALANWSAKGIAGNPSSPNPRQYEMRLECKDHEIYSGLPAPAEGTHVWSETIGGEEYRHVIMVDSTKSPYNGVAYNASTSDKPALQGFNGSAAGSLLGLGRILNGSLQAAIERQEEPAARLMLFGLNAKALPNALTDEGKQVIANILTYLLKTNMEEVDDCSNYFTGRVDSDWSKADNWSKKQLPSSETKVRILAPCVISGIQPHVLQVSIVNSGNSNIRYTATDNALCDGTLTINADGALIADGKIRSAVAPHFAANDLMPTTPEMLTINTGSDGQAALIFNNEEGLTKATVNYYSLGCKIGSAYQFQYFAIPFEYLSVSPTFANVTHNTTIYTFVWHEASGWERRGYYSDLYAFEGVGITTASTSPINYQMKGTLASTAEREITLTKDNAGENIIGNSWMAPIDIASLKDAIGEDSNVDKVVYIYITGNDNGTGSHSSTETAGKWLAIPIDASGWSGWTGQKVIPAMQAYYIQANAETTLTLNYDEVVRSTAVEQLNVPLKAPRRTMNNDGISLLTLRLENSKEHTDLYLFEGERFSDGYDNGWEAKQMADEGVMQFYAMNGEDKMAVLATDELEGTPVCFTPGNESNYTISFFGGDGRYYLNDLKEEQSTAIEQGNTYSFTYEQGDMPHRFLISTTPFGIPSVTTGIGGVEAQEKVQKVIYNDHVYIIRGGKIYDVMGKMMK